MAGRLTDSVILNSVWLLVDRFLVFQFYCQLLEWVGLRCQGKVNRIYIVVDLWMLLDR